MNKNFFIDYLDRHNIVYDDGLCDRNQPAIVGTGILGACVWQEDNDICIQVTNVDASPQGQMSSGIIRIKTDFEGKCKAKLILKNGLLCLNFTNGESCKIYGGCGEEFLYVDIHSEFKHKLNISLELWDTSCITQNSFRWGRMVKNPSDWKNATFNACKNAIFMSRGSTSGYGEQGVDEYEDISDETCFGYTLGVTVKNQECKLLSDSCLEIDDSIDCKILIANPSRFTNKDTITECAKMLDYKCEDSQTYCEKFWNSFWEKSYVICHSKQSDYEENIYFVSKYILACGMMGKTALHFISGNFRNNGDDGTVWAVAYWWYNQRCLYSGFLPCGNFDFIKTQLDLYFNNMDKIIADTKLKYPNSEGMVVAETMCWDGRRSFSENSPGAVVAEFINCTGLEISLKMLDYCLYSGDDDYLQNKFLPFAKKCLDFQISYELKLGVDGKYFIPAGIANARESYVKIGNPITEFAALKSLLPNFIAVAQKFDCNTSKYEDVLSKLPDFKIGGYPKRFLSGDDGINFNRSNWDDPCLEAVYPFNLVYNGSSGYNEMINNFYTRIGRDRIMRCLTWDNSGIWAARLGLSDDIMSCIRLQIAKAQVMNCGIGTDGNCKYEFSGNIISAFNESMLQSFDGIIRVFPAVYQDEGELISRFKLYAKGGFIVESEYDYKFYQAKYVNITSGLGGKLKIYNPYGKGREAKIIKNNVVTLCDEEIIELDTFKNEEISITLNDLNYEDVILEYKDNKKAKSFVFDSMKKQLGN